MPQSDDQNGRIDEQSKQQQLDPHREDPAGEFLTTNQGVRVNHTDDSLKAGSRGPTLMEDFLFREKMTHFDHERIPERAVHARGSGAHGYFQPYPGNADITRAAFLQDPNERTPVFVRFSTVAGSRGSADTVRDARGFATKFYTREGVFDLVGNNIPVFFIQDGIKFPDLVHSIKPEPHNEMPQASAAHDTFWDFISLMPESMHMIMWAMSDRALPRSFRMMEGFGVHTFRFINAEGTAHFVKFHWKPLLGVHGLTWDESQKLGGKDPDWLRRDLWNAIEAEQYPEYELGVQIVDESDEFAFDFDLLDATKIIPEELVPVRRLGKMVLNRNPDNFFAETEQAAFHPGHVVPGIDFTNDPLLQGRLFSYLDTQLIRLGGPNFHELPINRSVAEVHNNQRDGYGRQTINKGRVAYFPNSLGNGCPMMTPEHMGGYVHYQEKVDGHKIRERSDSFKDHYTQATLFWNSMSEPEQQHMIEALRFELGKVDVKAIRQRMIDHLSHIDMRLASETAKGIGIRGPSAEAQQMPVHRNNTEGKRTVDRSPALSMENTRKDTIYSRRVGILAADGVDSDSLMQVKQALEAEGATTEIISKFQGTLQAADGSEVEVDQSFVTTASVMYDALFIPGGDESAATLGKQGDAIHFINEAFKHCKALGAIGAGVNVLSKANLMEITTAGSQADSLVSDKGVVSAATAGERFNEAFKQAIAQHRHWEREAVKDMVPA